VSGKNWNSVKPVLRLVVYDGQMAIEAVPQMTERPDLWHTDAMQAQERHERFPNPNRVMNHMVATTSHVASVVDGYLRSIDRLQIGDPNFDPAKIEMDNLAAAALRQMFTEAPFIINSKLSEGKKDEEKTKLKVDTVVEISGHGKRFNSAEEIPARYRDAVDVANDPVEGTDSAMLGEPGAIVVVGIGDAGGMHETPKGIKYMKKLAAPPELNGVIHIDMDDKELLDAAARKLGIRPEDITVVGLDGPGRERNFPLRDNVRDFGSNWMGISRGDLVPGIKATRGFENGKLLLAMGIGGYEEGVITAAATGNGAVVMGRPWHKDPEIRAQNDKLLLASDLVGGNPDHRMVVYSVITPDSWFGSPGVQIVDGEKRIYSQAFVGKDTHRFLHVIPQPHSFIS
jgi:fructose-1,6-bisphosphatase/sedoheptulose 1,7-bisphosphatase-like protein